MFSLVCVLSIQSWGWWFETPSRSLWRHCNASIDYYQWIIGSIIFDVAWVTRHMLCKGDLCIRLVVRGGGYYVNFLRENTRSLLNITYIYIYIYDRCYRDSNNLRGTFARSKILLTQKFTNGALVTPTPETPRLRGCNVAHVARVIYIYIHDIYMCVCVYVVVMIYSGNNTMVPVSVRPWRLWINK